MATPTIEIKAETNLQGVLVSSLSTVGLSVQVQFFDNKTGVARTPQSDTLIFTIDKDNANAETILADSHSTLSGVTTILINASGRNIPKFGVAAGSGTGFSHVVGAEIGSVDIARPLNKIAQILGEKANLEGATFTGQVNVQAPLVISGTTSYLEVPELTTTERDALPADEGQIIYNTTTGEFNGYQAGVWQPFSSGSTQPNASETVAGKVELATAAEISAGTSVGGTGARLVPPNDAITPFLMPTGAILEFGGSAAPTGYLLCDGTAVNRVTFAALFAVVGTTFGVGDGATTFNVPDFRGRAPYGKAAAGTYGTLGGTGGTETKNVTHTHALSGTGARALIGEDTAYGDAIVGWTPAGGGFAATKHGRATGGHTTTDGGGAVINGSALEGSTATSGSATQDVTNPFLVINYIIKT